MKTRPLIHIYRQRLLKHLTVPRPAWAPVASAVLRSSTGLIRRWGWVLPLIAWTSLTAAEDYVLSTFEAAPPHPIVASTFRPPRCQLLFAPNPQAVVRVSQLANFSVNNGVRDDTTRGQRIHEQAIERFGSLTAGIVQRILGDWSKQPGFSASDLQRIYETHQGLSPLRTKFVTIENMPQAFFSGLRIYDSSPVMKDRGRPWLVPGDASDRREVSERVFDNHRLSKLFEELGLKRERHTWSLGLLDISENREKALQTVLSKAADLLDLHYNNRDYFNLGRTDAIKADNVDIVFYANARLKEFYQRVLKVSPLRTSRGQELVLHPKQPSSGANDFYLFHLKGSDFIERFLKFEYQEPMFATPRGFGQIVERHRFLTAKMRQYSEKMNPADYRVRDLVDLLRRLKALFQPLAMRQRAGLPIKEEEFWEALAKVVMIRSQLPADLYENYDRPEVQAALKALIELPGARLIFQIDSDRIELEPMARASLILMIDTIIQDPLLFVVNRMQLR